MRAKRRVVRWVVVGAALIALALLVRSPAVRYRLIGRAVERYLIPSYVADCRAANPVQRARALRMIIALRRGLSDKAVDRAQDLLLESLTDGEPAVRLAAAEAAGDFALQPAAPELQRLAARADEPLEVRRAAVVALGKIAPPSALYSLLLALQSDEERLRYDAEWALVRIGDPAVPRTAALLHSDDPDVRRRAASVLAKLGAPAVPPLVAALQSPERDLAELAADVLAETGGPAISSLAATLDKAPSARSRVLAATTLGRIIEEQPTGLLLDTYSSRSVLALRHAARDDPQPAVRRAAISSLASIARLSDDQQAALTCIEALADPDLDVRQETEHSLNTMGRIAADVLHDELAKLNAPPPPADSANDVAALIDLYRQYQGLKPS